MAREDQEKRIAARGAARAGKTAEELLAELKDADAEQGAAADEVANQDQARWRPEA